LELGGYDLAWVVMERLPGDPLAARLHKEVFVSLAEAAASFYKYAGEAFPEITKAQRAPWTTLVAKARAAVKENHIPNEQEWSNVLREVTRHLPTIVERWRQRPIDTWCHGDLHPGNMMVREEGSPWGEAGCVLIDMAEVHPGNWIEDAVYLERLYWGRQDAVKGIKPVAKIAKARRQIGLPVSDDYAELANIRRVLMAACVPAFLHREGHPKYLEGALGILNKLLPLVAR
jgi:Ser/Thr protein kinase RdoA (MazF antagonist)